MRLVVDASVVLRLCLAADGFGLVTEHDLAAPVLLRSEVLSALHEAVWRRDISTELGTIAASRLSTAPVTYSSERDLWRHAWDVADRLGWAKTYDAEYVALAEREGLPLLTLDARLARGARRLVRTMTPSDLS